MRDRGVLRFDGVGLRRGGHALLDAVDLALPVRARTVILGPNGAGKSTLLQLAHGLARPDVGRIDGIDGEDRAVRWRFGFVFQRPVMLRRSALGNVVHALAVAGVPRPERRARAERALAEVGLLALAGRSARLLSGGEQQRLAIARAEACAPDCLLLDEPTASLDPHAAIAVETLLRTLSERGRGLVWSTHDLGQARRLAEHVVLLVAGRVLETGPAEDFFAGPGTEAARRFLRGDPL